MGFDTPINSGDQSFERVLRAGLPVLALFSAGAPDASTEDALKELAKANADRLLVTKIRAGENPALVSRFSIRAPTLLTFKDGNEYSRAEMPAAGEVRAHAEYVMGRGPKPTAPPPPPAEPSPPPRAEPAQGAPLRVTDATFARDVLGSSLPVVVDFWADWCGPCHRIAPTLEKLAREYAGRVRIAKLNVDENPRTGSQYQVQGIPTLLMVKNGRVLDRLVGAAPEPQIRAQIERLLKS
jgi:thioredoxin 1